ncbi:hypothetical protein EVAR_41766_1 [Eumeta japonica]|uniref:Uncharacterized protein n=1 Tax=Eumeta variegata TaxID=151549 RepID=A0A4C1VZ93_EUMVA|nr:hypothetical protein EVAR_41766_1 [Eumeta japonica]
MYSRQLASARQVEPVNQALGTVIFSGVYHKGTCPLPCKILARGGAPQDVNSLTGIDSGSRRSPTGCKLTHRNRFWLEEEPHRITLVTKAVARDGRQPRPGEEGAVARRPKWGMRDL